MSSGATRRRLAGNAGLVLLAWASLAVAEPVVTLGVAPPPTPTGEAARDRTLLGHVFLVPISQPSAFVNTYFGVRQAVSFQSIPRLPLTQSTVNLRLLGVHDDVDLGVKLLPWLGVFGNFQGSVKLGVNTDTLIARGGNYALGGSGGALFRILRLERCGTQVAARFSGGYESGKTLNVYPLSVAIYDALANRQVTSLATLEQALLTNLGKYVLIPASTASYALQLHAAQAFSPNFSFQFTIGGVHESTTLQNYDLARNGYVRSKMGSWLFDLAFALTADGSPQGIPVAAMLEYTVLKGSRKSIDLSVSSSTPAVKEINFGLYYTGRANLQAGAGASFLISQEPVTAPDGRKSGSPSEIVGSFILRYLW
jgi:hypothetical protein